MKYVSKSFSFSLLKTAAMPLLACLAGATGCAASRAATPEASPSYDPGPTLSEIQRASAGIVGCRPSDIVIQNATYDEFHEVWELKCPTGEWICSRQDKFGHEYINCAAMPK